MPLAMTPVLQNDDNGQVLLSHQWVATGRFCVWAMSLYAYFRARRRIPAWADVFPPFSVQFAVILIIHFAALVVMAATEVAVLPKVLFLLSWGILNFFWLMVSRRPGVSAALSLAMVVALILVSRLKHGILMLTANFVDVM